MRSTNSFSALFQLSRPAYGRGLWTGRIILAALLMAAFAIVVMPDRAAGHHAPGTDYATHCQGLESNGDMMQELVTRNMVTDCIALLTATDQLTLGDDTTANWLTPRNQPGQLLPILGPPQMGSNRWDGVVIQDLGQAPNVLYRVTRVDLSAQDLSGTLAPEWADLTAMTSFNLSGNNVSGTVPLAVWEFLDGLDALNLDDNKDLRPSPPLNLGAVSSKTAGGEPQVALSFDNIWFTTEVRTHEYRYSADGGSTWGPNETDGSDGWMAAATGCTDPADSAMTPDIDPGSPVLCVKDNGATPPVRNRSSIETGALPRAETFIFQVRAVKETPYTDDKGTPDDDADDTEEVQTTRSQIAQIDVLAPQVLTAESDFLLELDVTYALVDPLPDAAVLVVETSPNGLQFTPKAATNGNDIVLSLTQPAAEITDSQGNAIGQAGGSHTFPVDIKPASGAPTFTFLPNRSMLTTDQPARLTLGNFFQGDGLTYVAGSSRLEIATVEVDSEAGELVMTPLRAGVTNITVVATDVNRGKAIDTFRLTVVSPNISPTVAGIAPDLTLFLDDPGTQLDMTPYFRDEDGDTLRFIPQSTSPNVVTASASGNSIPFNVVGLGEARMTVIAEDPAGATAFVVFTVTVLEPNEPPLAVGSIPAQTLRVGDPPVALDLAPYFTDPDGDPLTHAAQSADESIAAVEIAGSVATLTGIAAGKTTLTVTATDPRGESELQAIAVMVLPANRPPEAVGSVGHQVLVEGGSPLSIDMAEYFSDPDGDALSFAASSANPGAVQVVIISGSSSLAISPLSPAEAVDVTVTATDGDGASAEQQFMVTVAAASAPVTPVATNTPVPDDTPAATRPPEPTATPDSTAMLDPTERPEPTASPEPDEGGGFPWGWILALLVLAAGIGAAIFIIRRRGGDGGPPVVLG